MSTPSNSNLEHIQPTEVLSIFIMVVLESVSMFFLQHVNTTHLNNPMFDFLLELMPRLRTSSLCLLTTIIDIILHFY